jgi:hypothetical protein
MTHLLADEQHSVRMRPQAGERDGHRINANAEVAAQRQKIIGILPGHVGHGRGQAGLWDQQGSGKVVT